MALPSSAAADQLGGSPFSFRAFCSTCGPQTPLTLEQADAVEFVTSDFLDDILTGPDTFPVAPDAPIGLGGPPVGGGGGSPAPGVGIPGFVSPPSNNSGGGVPGGGGNPGGGNAGGGMLAEGMLAAGMLAEGTPAEGTPAEGMLAEGMPAVSTMA